MNHLNILIKKNITRLSKNDQASKQLSNYLELKNEHPSDFKFYAVRVGSPFYKMLYKHDDVKPNASQHSSARMIGQFMDGKDAMFIESDRSFSNDRLYFTVNKSETIPEALGLTK